MSDAPERIWAGDFHKGLGHCTAGMQGGLYEEYIRADIAERDLAEARAERDRLKRENHDLGNEIDSLEEEGCDADDTIRKLEAERDRLAAEVESLPFSVRDIKRGLILFRTSNNAHDYTNFVSLTAKVEALPQVAKDELAQIMRNIAESLSPARASLQTGEKGE